MSTATDIAATPTEEHPTEAITPIPIPETTQGRDATPDPVAEQLGRIVSDLGSALTVLLISLGTRSGLWTAMAGAGPLTAEQVSQRVAVDPALVREWMRAQAAGGYLTYDGAMDTFTLPDPVAAALLQAPGGALVEACIPMVTSIAEGFDEFAEAFAAGRGFGWHQRSAQHWHGTDALTRLTVPGELIEAAIAAIPDVADALRAGGTAADIGCGYGAPTIAVATSYPDAEVLGVDYHDASVMHARRAAAAAGIGNVRFEVQPATGLSPLEGRGYDLITFFDSLHDIGDPLGALRQARARLAPAGAVVLFEPLGADRVQDNLNPNGRMFYAISTLACTPNAVSQRTATSSEPLGAQAGERALRDLAATAGFGSVRRVDVPLPLNLVLELRA